MADSKYNNMTSGGKAASDGFKEKGKTEKIAFNPKETCNPSATVPKLPQLKGAE